LVQDVHIKLDDRSYELLQRLKDERFGTTRRTIERALATLYESTSAELTPADIMFLAHRRQLRLLTLDRPLFSKILAGSPRDYEDYPHVALLKYMTPKRLRDLTLDELVELMQEVYASMFNWFDKIDVDRDDAITVTYYHNTDQNYSQFMAEYHADLFRRLHFEVEEVILSDYFFALRVHPGAWRSAEKQAVPAGTRGPRPDDAATTQRRVSG